MGRERLEPYSLAGPGNQAALACLGGCEVVRVRADGVEIWFGLDATGPLRAAVGAGPGNALAMDIRLAEMLTARQMVPDPIVLTDPAAPFKSSSALQRSQDLWLAGLPLGRLARRPREWPDPRVSRAKRGALCCMSGPSVRELRKSCRRPPLCACGGRRSSRCA